MLSLPNWMIPILTEFAPVFYGVSTWYKVEVLVVGAILTTGKRTVSAALRVMGLSQEKKYAQYHQVLNRAVCESQWFALAVFDVADRDPLGTAHLGAPLLRGTRSLRTRL